MFHNVDKILLLLTGLLVIVGYFIFSSASLGLLARDGASFSSVAFSQFIFGIVGGGAALLITSHIHYRHWRKYAFYIFIIGLILTLAVFIPGLGFSYGGATRWISLGSFTFQPAEILKIAFVIYMATWLSGTYRSIETYKKGLFPFIGLLGLVGVVMLLQPDTDTYAIMVMAAVAMFLTAGGSWRHIAMMGVGGLILIAILAFSRPYIMDRLTTFIDPSLDPLGKSYQVQQSLIAVGSGGVSGRGFGQSIQKFEYLPEPTGDSIFAVYAEEFGFIGTSVLILLLTFFVFRGYKIAAQAKDLFGMLLVVGFMTVIIAQAFLNIAAMLSLAPLSGLPLPFISHGGTALLALLASIGIVLNVSKFKKPVRGA
ncbi:MAG: putative peptidoglycan glycosyltransferase FtsW [Patescibacteria group bacterium]